MPKHRSLAVAFAVLASLIPDVNAGTLPRPAPDFAINLPGGKQVLLSQYKGKTVALTFILTYCPHCQKIVSFLSKDQNEYGARGFQVLASAIEDGAAAAVPGFIKKFNPPFPVGSNARVPVLDFLQHPIAARLIMPQIVLIDRKGMIRAQYAGNEPFLDEAQADQNLRGKIEELLNESMLRTAKKK
ncbi:MAG TPA: TlpA disulfide reductase family protein [Bryobacteraceae bacterium]|jgi:peroxiredoxin